MNIATSPRWSPATLTDKSDKDPMTIDYKFTPAERDHAVLCELEVAAMRRHRDPPGLLTGEASQADWDKAVEERRHAL